MNKVEILEKIVKKALKGGWDINGLTDQITWSYEIKPSPWEETITNPKVKDSLVCNPFILCHPDFGDPYKLQIEKFFWKHDFAKAFWGEDWEDETLRKNFKSVVSIDGGKTWLKPWQYHLQQLVLEENPFNYLKKFV